MEPLIYYLIGIIALLIIAFVLYIKFKLINKEELLKIIDTVISQDEALIPIVPPDDVQKLLFKNEALRILRQAIKEDWIPIQIEREIKKLLEIEE